jgi:hypothetical protein
MSTRLTLGTVAAFVGLAHGIIDRQQYAILVTTVIASGTISALMAQKRLQSGSARPRLPWRLARRIWR